MRRMIAAGLLALTVLGSACASEKSETSSSVSPVLVDGSLPRFENPATLRVMTHDSFAVSQSVLDEFESATNVRVELVPSGDAAAMTNAAILTVGTPVAGLLFGLDVNHPWSARLCQRLPYDRTDGPREVDHGIVCE